MPGALALSVALLGQAAPLATPASPPAETGQALSAALLDRASQPETTVATHPAWYGWQLLAADAGVVGLASAGFMFPHENGGAKVGAAVLMYLLDGPILHAAHGRGGGALRSVALRLGLPLAGALVGGTIGSELELRRHRENGHSLDDGCAGCGGVLGAFIGAGLQTVPAMIIDAVLAWEPRPTAARTPAEAVEVFPTATVVSDASRRSVSVVGIGGAF
jgi:hypothetical protein